MARKNQFSIANWRRLQLCNVILREDSSADHYPGKRVLDTFIIWGITSLG